MKVKTEMKKGYYILKRIEKDLLKLDELNCIVKYKEYQRFLNWVIKKANFYNIVIDVVKDK